MLLALRTAVVAALLGLAACGAAFAATPSSGTLTPLTPVTWTGGPITAANPSNNVPGSDGPDCTLVPNSCDDFLLTITVPAGYTALHPNHVVTIKVQWPTTTNDFDVYVLNPATNTSAQAPAATNGDPEIASWPVVDGSVTYRVRVAAFTVVNETYTATATIGAPSANTTGIGQYAASTDVWTCNQHLGADTPTGPPPVFDHNLDAEPAVKFDPNGKFYVSAIAGVPAGSGLWSTSDACGQAYSFYGAPDAGLGGGDTELETAVAPNALGNYNVYMSSLTLANLTTAVSFDGGNNFLFTPISTVTPVVDRQWNAAYGPSIVYMSYRQGATNPGNFLECVRLDYSAMGAPVISPASVVWLGLDPNLARELGNMVVDRRPTPTGTLPLTSGPNGEGNVYHGWTEEGHKVFVSVSHDFGTTWTHHLVWDGGLGTSYNHKFTWLAVDSDGNVFNVFSDDRNVYLSSSSNQGVTWSRPLRVNAGGASNVAIFPHIAAGSPGRVAITFYGHSGTSSQDPAADWKVFVVRSQNALAASALFEEKQVSNRFFHSGPVCEQGLACACCRELTECYDIDIDPVDGSAAIAYGSFGVAGTYISRQVKGVSSLVGRSVQDRSASCPTPANNCNTVAAVRNACILPGDLVVTDPTGTNDTPPVANAQQDIESISVAEPSGIGNSLVFTMKVTSLNLASLPPNAFWRVIWQGPGTGTANQHYVAVYNCAVGGLTAEYGHFTTGAVSDGPADAFTLLPDGTVRITIAKSKVGSPTPGTLLSAVNGDCRNVVGNCPPTAAAFAPIDVTNSGQYLVLGNDYCTPLQLTCESNTTQGPGDHTVTFEVKNPSTATRTVAANLNDSNGWLVGGSAFLAIPSLGPGQSQSLSRTLRLPSNCTPTPVDVLTWAATASDLPGSVQCQTQYTCDTATPTLVSRFDAEPAGDGVDLAWAPLSTDGIVAWNLYRGTTAEAAIQRVNAEPIRVDGSPEYRYHDVPGTTGEWFYRLTGVTSNGTEMSLIQTRSQAGSPLAFAFGVLGANPFRGGTRLSYTLPQRAPVRIEVFNVTGQRVRTLVNREDGAGNYQVAFALGGSGGERPLPAGIYLVRLTAGREQRSVRVVGLN